MREEDSPRGMILGLYRTLLAAAVLLAVVIAAGTAYGLAKRNAARRPPAAAGEQAEGEQPAAGIDYYTGIGRLRAASADAHPAAIVISITFPFDKSDIAFTEELALKTKTFRAIAAAYLSGFSAERLRAEPEDSIKEELLKRFNSELRLGRIGSLYFSEFMILD